MGLNRKVRDFSEMTFFFAKLVIIEIIDNTNWEREKKNTYNEK